MTIRVSTLIPTILFVGVCIAFVLWEAPRELLIGFVGEPSPEGYALFVLALALAVVLMPLTAMPLVPMGTMMFGPLPTAILSVVGWTLGAVGAFVVARTLARPVLSRFVNLSVVDSLITEYPAKTRFLVIVLMRLTIPVDIASYALGLTKGVRIGEYTLATFLGVIWFSFAFAYMGDTLIQNDILGLIGVGGVSALIFTGAYLYLKHIKKVQRDNRPE